MMEERKSEALGRARLSLQKWQQRLGTVRQNLEFIREVVRHKKSGAPPRFFHPSARIEEELTEEMEAILLRINTTKRLIEQLENKVPSPRRNDLEELNNRFINQIKSLSEIYESNVNDILHFDVNLKSNEINENLITDEKTLMKNVIKEMKCVFNKENYENNENILKINDTQKYNLIKTEFLNNEDLIKNDNIVKTSAEKYKKDIDNLSTKTGSSGDDQLNSYYQTCFVELENVASEVQPDMNCDLTQPDMDCTLTQQDMDCNLTQQDMECALTQPDMDCDNGHDMSDVENDDRENFEKFLAEYVAHENQLAVDFFVQPSLQDSADNAQFNDENKTLHWIYFPEIKSNEISLGFVSSSDDETDSQRTCFAVTTAKFSEDEDDKNETDIEKTMTEVDDLFLPVYKDAPPPLQDETPEVAEGEATEPMRVTESAMQAPSSQEAVLRDVLERPEEDTVRAELLRLVTCVIIVERDVSSQAALSALHVLNATASAFTSVLVGVGGQHVVLENEEEQPSLPQNNGEK